MHVAENAPIKVLDLTEPKVKQLRIALATRMTFFNDLRTLTRYFYFQSWEQLLDFMLTQLALQSLP